MKLLINICSHDGIISHYNGVGSMTIKYIRTFSEILKKLKIDYEMNLYTPEYDSTSFGYNNSIKEIHENMPYTKIYQISNGSNKKVNYGNISNWQQLCINTAKKINSISIDKYDKVITIFNDTPFCCLAKYLDNDDKHKKILILHSSVKIHEVDSAIENSILEYDKRLKWEIDGIKFINDNDNCYYGSICEYFSNHLIKEYGLKTNKILNIYNGELFHKIKHKYSKETKELFKDIKDYESIIISYGRAEEYKNLEASFYLGKLLNIKSIVVAQLYYKEQPIRYFLEEEAKKYNGLLYIDPPFDLPEYILTHFKGKIICLIPSKKEIMGLIVNEVRKLKKDNLLIVANNIGGLSEQITNGYDGVLVDLESLEEAKEKINYYFNKKDMQRMKKNSIKTLHEKYDFYTIALKFIKNIIGR